MVYDTGFIYLAVLQGIQAVPGPYGKDRTQETLLATIQAILALFKPYLQDIQNIAEILHCVNYYRLLF